MESASIAELSAQMEVAGVINAIVAFCITTGCLYFAALMTEFSEKLMRNLSIGILVGCFAQLFFMFTLLFSGVESWFLAGYCIIGVVLTGVYILVDLLMIMTPDAISHDDYILGAVMLYIDLVRMFLYMLILMAKRD